MSILGGILSTIAGPLFKVIDDAVEDKDQANLLKSKLESQLIGQAGQELESRMKVIMAEANGESWLQRNWRPVLMLVIVAIVGNNYLIAPYLGALFDIGLQLPLPERLWDLMTMGVGGYIAGRSGEKIVKSYRGTP